MFNRKLKDEIERLTSELEKAKQLGVARISIKNVLDEGIPREPVQRKAYMTQVAGFYIMGFDKKLSHMIVEQKNALAMMGLTDRESDIYRSNINCLCLLDDWFRGCLLEHQADLSQAKQNQADNENIISSLKEKYNG